MILIFSNPNSFYHSLQFTRVLRQRNLTDAYPGKVSRPNYKQDLAIILLPGAQCYQSRHAQKA